MIADELPAILQRLVKAAREGDMQAINLILSRTTPALRPQREATALPELASARSLSEQARAILSAVAAGEISSDQAAELLAAVANAASAIEVDELAARIAALEGRIDAHE